LILVAFRFAVEREDDVIGPEARALAGRARRDVLYQRAVPGRQLQRSAQVVVDIPERDANVAPADASACAKLRQDRAGQIDRYREADTGASGADRGVDPDHLAACVDERP